MSLALFDIASLTAFITTTQKDDQLSALLHEVNSIPRTVIDTSFAQSFPNGFDVSQIPIGHTIDSNLNTHPGTAISQL